MFDVWLYKCIFFFFQPVQLYCTVFELFGYCHNLINRFCDVPDSGQIYFYYLGWVFFYLYTITPNIYETKSNERLLCLKIYM